MKPFIHEHYKTILYRRVQELKTQNKRITFQHLASHCKLQKTYLSRVFRDEKSHLSQDQLFLALDFLGFGEAEQRYIQLLHERERTQLQSRRAKITAEIDQLRKENLKTDLQAPQANVSQNDWSSYYLDPDCQLVHLFLCIPRFATNAEAVRKKLELSKKKFDSILKSLLKMNLISVTDKGYRVEKESLHLPQHSPIFGPYRTLLRLKGLERMQKLNSEDSLSFSVLFSATPKEKRWIQSEFLTFLKRIEQVVGKAKSQEVYQIGFDLFDWSLE